MIQTIMPQIYSPDRVEQEFHPAAKLQHVLKRIKYSFV